MNSLSDILEIQEKITELLESADKILDVATSYPPQISENSTMYFSLDSWVNAMQTINRQHMEAFIELECEIKPKEKLRASSETRL
jgi:hypothetical protein